MLYTLLLYKNGQICPKEGQNILQNSSQCFHHFDTMVAFTTIRNVLRSHARKIKGIGRKKIGSRRTLKYSEMPKLDELTPTSLEKPIVKEEWEEAIKTSKRGTVPGPDGFTDI